MRALYRPLTKCDQIQQRVLRSLSLFDAVPFLASPHFRGPAPVQDIYANLENATTILRDEGRHRGTVIEFLGSHDAVVVRETPNQILKLAEGENPN